MSRCARWILLAWLMVGCAVRPPAAAVSAPEAQRIHLDLVRGMMAQAQYFAALAHIQEQRRQGYQSGELQLLEAEALRKLKRMSEAERAYQGLLNTALAAEASSGLGLLYADRDLARSLGFLRKAVQMRPASASMRNDLGYALLLAGRHAEALPELATAAELAPDQREYTNNLILLLVLMKDETGLQRVAAQAGVDKERLRELRRQAQGLKPVVKRR